MIFTCFPRYNHKRTLVYHTSIHAKSDFLPHPPQLTYFPIFECGLWVLAIFVKIVGETSK